MVATPAVTSSSTGESVMPRSLSGPQAPGDEPVGAGLEAVRLGGEQLGRVVPGPVVGQQRLGQPRVGEQELAPLVDQVEAGGEGRLVLVVVRREVLVDQVVGGL